MTIENKIAIAAIIVAFASPFMKALAERWITKPTATPVVNKPASHAQRYNRFSRFLMSDTFELILSLMPLAIAIVLATAPVSGFTVLAIAFGVSSFSIQFMLKPRLNRLRKDVDDLIRIVNALP